MISIHDIYPLCGARDPHSTSFFYLCQGKMEDLLSKYIPAGNTKKGQSHVSAVGSQSAMSHAMLRCTALQLPKAPGPANEYVAVEQFWIKTGDVPIV